MQVLKYTGSVGYQFFRLTFAGRDFGLEKQPFGLHGWLGMDMSFYSNASDNMVVVMDCGDLETLYGAASETGYKKLMGVMEGLGEAI
jgi:hypothetical protein